MGLINQYSADNRAIESALSVSYFKRMVSGTWVGTSVVASSASVTYANMDEYHRVARKSYKYVGMTYEAAQACASDMRTLYTRTVKHQYWSSTAGTMGDWVTLQGTSSELLSEIVVSHVGGAMWEVTVNVNEDSIYMAKTDDPKSYTLIFYNEMRRSYDGEYEVNPNNAE